MAGRARGACWVCAQQGRSALVLLAAGKQTRSDAMAVNHAIYIWTGPDNQKHLLLPERSPAVLNTPFLGWEIAVPRGALPPVPAVRLGLE